MKLSCDDFSKKASSSSVAAAVDALIQEHPILIFSKSYCPYTPAIQSLLSDELQCTIHILEINQASSEIMKDVQDYLKSKTTHRTVPQIFLEGSFLGTHDGVVEMDQKGLLEPKVQKLMKGPRQAPTNKDGYYTPLFFFPVKVNKWAIRATGLLSSGISAGLAYCMLQETPLHAPVLGLASASLLADYTLRLFAGSGVSPVAQLGGLLASGKDPIPRPGAPKQFATLCGVMFSGMGYAFYAQGNPTVGGAFLAILALCAGMEGGLDFCLGCEFFHIGEKIYLATSGKKEKKA